MKLRKIALCFNCKKEVTRVFAYDDAYVGKSRWGTEGWGTYCNNCKTNLVIEKKTYKTYSNEKWWGKPRFDKVIIHKVGMRTEKVEYFKGNKLLRVRKENLC